jgi:5-methylcytosine-specific restriction endonuclease McrA
MDAGISKALRNLVFERDSYTCVICENPANDAHHVIPRALGGRNNKYNLVSLCRLHHMVVHNETETIDDWTKDEIEQTLIEYLSDYYVLDFIEFSGL